MTKVVPIISDDSTKVSLSDVKSFGLKLLVLCQYRWFRILLFITITVVFSLAFGLGIYGKTFRKGEISKVILLVDHLTHFLLTSSNISGIRISWCYNPRVAKKIVRQISSKKGTRTFFGVVSSMFNGFSLLTMALNFYTFSSDMGYKVAAFFILRDLQLAFYQVTLYSLSEIYYSMKEMFADINEDLKSVHDQYFNPLKLNLETHVRKNKELLIKNTVNVLKRICNNHNQLCEDTDELNDMLAHATFFAFISIVINILWPVTILIEYDLPKLVNTPADPVVICNFIMHSLCILTLVVQAIIMAATGRLLKLEGEKTCVLCYKMIHTLNTKPFQDKCENLLKDRLLLLARQSDSRCPVFSAAGFFPVNLSVLGMIGTNVVAFIIVVIQFILNDKQRQVAE